MRIYVQPASEGPGATRTVVRCLLYPAQRHSGAPAPRREEREDRGGGCEGATREVRTWDDVCGVAGEADSGQEGGSLQRMFYFYVFGEL